MVIPFLRDLASILIALELVIVVLPFLVLLYFGLKVVGQLKQLIRQHGPKAQASAQQLKRITDRAADIAAAPVITIYSILAGGKGAARGMLKVLKGRTG